MNEPKQSEVKSERENKYYILMKTHGVQKDSADEPTCRAAMEIKTQRTDLWKQQERRRWDKLRELH